MTVRLRAVDQFVVEMDLRMPFHFGNTTLESTPHLFVRVEGGGDLTGEHGLAAEGLSPLWFLKEPGLSFDAGLDRMLAVIDHAVAAAQEIDAETVFDFWRALYDRQREWAKETEHPPLLWSFGVSLVERAVIDAFCRARGITFGEAVRTNALGVDLGAIHHELDGTEPGAYLPTESRRSTAIRHTVGFTDPLTPDDIDPADRLDDGLPQSLAAYVERQGVSYLKVKLCGDPDRDARRLERLAAVLGDVSDDGLDEFTITLDANEQYGDADSFRRDWERVTTLVGSEGILENVLYVEQPLARGDALTAATESTFTDWDDRPPMIIDESDGELDSLRRALACGYVGTSHKNCKGVFKGLANACLIEQYRTERDGDEYVISGEDLTTVGPVALLQDLAVMATMGTPHVERNGHHYFRGLTMYPQSVQSAVLDTHDDCYTRHEQGFPTLDVVDGTVQLDSVVDAPFGYGFDLEVDQFTPRPDWETER